MIDNVSNFNELLLKMDKILRGSESASQVDYQIKVNAKINFKVSVFTGC